MKPHSKLPFKIDVIDGDCFIEDKNDDEVACYMLASDAEYLVHAANNFQEAVNILETIKTDAEMALSDEWDRSDDGFKDQLDNINEFLNKSND